MCDSNGWREIKEKKREGQTKANPGTVAFCCSSISNTLTPQCQKFGFLMTLSQVCPAMFGCMQTFSSSNNNKKWRLIKKKQLNKTEKKIMM